MGWLPMWARLASAAPALVNTLTHNPPHWPGQSRLPVVSTGAAPPSPRFARQRFTDWWAHRAPPHPPAPPGAGGTVLLWPDTFTNNFDPHIAKDAVTVLEAADFTVEVPPEQTVCCGLTWISTGQLATAQNVLTRTLQVLAPALRTGTPPWWSSNRAAPPCSAPTCRNC